MIYLDHHASTAVRPESLEAFTDAVRQPPGNPHVDTHWAGAAMAKAAQRARERISESTGFDANDVVVTSGATEANNLVIAGLAGSLRSNGRPVIVAPSTEHKCILEAGRREADRGSRFVELEVTSEGKIKAADHLNWEAVGLLSAMSANNEIGTLETAAPSIIQTARRMGVIVHSDAAQLLGRVPARSTFAEFDAISLSGHKFGAPPGVGVLLLRRAVRHQMLPQMLGGGQQMGLRSGTVSVPLLAAFAAALENAEACALSEGGRMRALSRDFCATLRDLGVTFVLRGPSIDERLPGNLSLSFPGVNAMALALSLRDQVAFSLGAACQTRAIEPSHVLSAIGLADDEVAETIRIGFGWTSTAQEARDAARQIADSVTALLDLEEYRS